MAAANTILEIPHEENVYLLCKKLITSGIADERGSDLFVVFISNEKKQIPLWHQKASHRADGLVLWDYHVICVQKKRDDDSPHPVVWDIDSTLQLPSSLGLYVADAIRPSFQLFSEYQRYFRIVHAPLFLRSFASDRRHMRDSSGNWTAEPPQYDPIVAQDGTIHNLNEYIEILGTDVSQIEPSLINAVFTLKLGVVVDQVLLLEKVESEELHYIILNTCPSLQAAALHVTFD
ncbi:N-terminal glutamine amidohydrolase-like protein, partial [Drosera capensis]